MPVRTEADAVRVLIARALDDLANGQILGLVTEAREHNLPEFAELAALRLSMRELASRMRGRK